MRNNAYDQGVAQAIETYKIAGVLDGLRKLMPRGMSPARQPPVHDLERALAGAQKWLSGETGQSTRFPHMRTAVPHPDPIQEQLLAEHLGLTPKAK